MNQPVGTSGRPPFIPEQLGAQKTLPGQKAQVGDSVARKELDIGLLAPEPEWAKSAATMKLPAPILFTPSSSTIAHLGSLGGNQVSADIYSVMVLFQKISQETRNTARTQRSADLQENTTAKQGAAKEMKSAAKARFNGAMFQGSFQILGGLAQAGLSARAASKTSQAEQMKSDGKGMLTEFKDGKEQLGPARLAALKVDGDALVSQAKITQATADKASAYSQAAGTLSAAGNMIAAGFNLKADRHDARRTEFEAQASVYETSVQHSNDTMQQMMDVIRDVRDKLLSILQSAVETNRGIARNI